MAGYPGLYLCAPAPPIGPSSYTFRGLEAFSIAGPVRLLPENNARQGFADAKQVATISRRLPPDLADAVQFMFITGWRSRSEVLPLTWGQVDFAGGFVRLEPGTTKTNEGRALPLIRRATVSISAPRRE